MRIAKAKKFDGTPYYPGGRVEERADGLYFDGSRLLDESDAAAVGGWAGQDALAELAARVAELEQAILPHGTLTVAYSGTPPSGARWSIDGGTAWNDFGASLSARTGTYTVSYKAVAHYATPQSQSATVAEGETTTVAAGAYVANPGTLTVIYSGTVPTGAQWSIDAGTAWNDFGSSVSLGPGGYTVSYKAVSGYTAPASQTVTVASDETTTLAAAAYTETPMGTLMVMYSGNLPSGAAWSIDGGTTWNSTFGSPGVAVPVGETLTITFRQVAGYLTPASQSVTITGTGEQKVWLESSSNPYAALVLYVNYPMDSSGNRAPSGAQWSIDGGATWHDFRVDVSPVPAGTYTITYKPVTGYTTPANESVVITGSTASTRHEIASNNLYVAYGVLTVHLTDNAGGDGRWIVDGTEYASDASASLAPGSYTVTFKEVAGYVTPSSQTATVTSASTTTLTAEYAAQATGTDFTVTYAYPGGMDGERDNGWAVYSDEAYTVSNCPTTAANGDYTRDTSLSGVGGTPVFRNGAYYFARGNSDNGNTYWYIDTTFHGTEELTNFAGMADYYGGGMTPPTESAWWKGSAVSMKLVAAGRKNEVATLAPGTYSLKLWCPWTTSQSGPSAYSISSVSSVPSGVLTDAQFGSSYSAVSNNFAEHRIYTLTVGSSAITVTVSCNHDTCLVEGTMIALADGTKKPVEAVTYEDELLCWDFDEGRLATAKPATIKPVSLQDTYFVNTFADGSELLTNGRPNKGHEFFDLTQSRFDYNARIAGHEVYTMVGPKRLVASELVWHETPVRVYHIITARHFNLFANGVLTSVRLNNLYPIADMVYDKSTQNTPATAEELAQLPPAIVESLRMAEQPAENYDYVKGLIAQLPEYRRTAAD